MGVLRAIFPRFHTDESQCRDAGSLEASRLRGEIVPRVNAAVTGSFTAARAQETLYLVSVGECFASHAENFGTQRLVVFRDRAIVANAPAEGSEYLARVADFDGNGQDELVMTGGFTGQGITEGYASLKEFRGANLFTIADFGKGYEDTCGSFLSDVRVSYSVVYLERGQNGALQPLLDPQMAGCE